MRSWGTSAFKKKTGSDTPIHTHTKLKTQKGMKRTETVTLHKLRKTKRSNINSNRWVTTWNMNEWNAPLKTKIIGLLKDKDSQTR